MDKTLSCAARDPRFDSSLTIIVMVSDARMSLSVLRLVTSPSMRRMLTDYSRRVRDFIGHPTAPPYDQKYRK